MRTFQGMPKAGAAFGIQLDLFSAPPPLATDAGLKMELMRPHKWACQRTMGQLPLVSIEVVPFEGRWMWSACLNSRNGSAQGYKALPKWERFAPSKPEALERAVDEARAFMHRATKDEQQRMAKWLGDVLSAVA
ncbi:hypothetical protein KVG88_30180 [Pseudomonas sp. SWRI74]|uniref:Uncharacterized protein n=1 Tax=Pseudomonas azerbaijanoccidentalis TaxID=2842347 RepID=A0ABS6QZH5_9PSED|nr:hypothetical protein [Pseudomonas azerbaijanoccidentalis]MBV4524344.1 hypothetical protein [Pseudomonas azerbaijanoccidentalis]